MKRSKKILIGVLCCLTLAVVLVISFGIYWYSKWSDDFSRLRREEYDTVFFSMYPTDYYEEEDYAYFRTMKIVKTSYPMQNSQIMKLYMVVALSSGNAIHTAYLGIDPKRVNTDDIIQITLENPDTMFEIVLSYPRIDYWLSMKDEEVNDVMDSYRDFAGMVLGLENVRVYYFGNAEWLLCNPGNYVDMYNTNKEVSQFLMCNSDDYHNYILNVENFHVRFNEARAIIDKYREQPLEYADASDWEIIFLGDSVFGNYEGSLSIQGVVKGFMNSKVYNCGYGGRSAALTDKTWLPLPAVAEGLITGEIDHFPKEEQVYKGVKQFVEAQHTDTKLIFVINHGLNDYFEGVPVKTDDPEDISSYCGAIRVAVRALQEAYPAAEIILQVPNYTIAFDYGTQIKSETGSVYTEYVDVVAVLAEELGVYLLDNYYGMPINEKNYYWYLTDICHPNEQGRFMMGIRLCDLLEKIILQNED